MGVGAGWKGGGGGGVEGQTQSGIEKKLFTRNGSYWHF